MLSRAESVEYAKGFFALCCTSAYLLFVFVFFIVTAAILERNNIEKFRTKMSNEIGLMLISFVFGVYCIYWTQFSGDFYWAYDFDYSGSLRPPFGSFLFASILWAAPPLIAGPILTIINEIQKMWLRR